MFTDHLKRTIARLLGLAERNTGALPSAERPRQSPVQFATAASFVLDRRPGLLRTACFVGGPMDGYQAEICQELDVPAARLIAVPVSVDMLAGLADGDPRQEGVVTSVAIYERCHKWGTARYTFVRSVNKETLR